LFGTARLWGCGALQIIIKEDALCFVGEPDKVAPFITKFGYVGNRSRFPFATGQPGRHSVTNSESLWF